MENSVDELSIPCVVLQVLNILFISIGKNILIETTPKILSFKSNIAVGFMQFYEKVGDEIKIIRS